MLILSSIGIFSALQLGTISEKTFKNIEMRAPAPPPKWGWSFQSIKDYFPKLEGYINDQFAMREKLIRCYAIINYSLGVSINPEKVVIGKEDYLFLGNRWQNIIDQTTGNDVFDRHHLNQLLYHMALRQKYLKKRGIEFYVFVVPNKHTIYPEYLPTWVTPSGKTTLSQLHNETKSFKFINPLTYLLSAKKKYGQRLYNKTDSHWSRLGAYIGYQVIIQAIRQDFPKTLPLTLESKDFIYTPDSCGGGLALMLRLDGHVNDFYMQIQSSKLQNSESIKKTDFNGYEQSLDPFNHIRWHEKALFSNTMKPYTVLVLMDSFMEKMAVFLNHTFGKTIYCHYKDVDGRTIDELVKKYRPDFVIYQMVERSLKLKESHLTAGNLIQWAFDFRTLSQFGGTDLHQHAKQLNAIAVQSQNCGVFSFKATSNDPYFTLPPSKLPKNSYLCLELEMISPEDTTLEVFYQTLDTYHYSPAQSVKQRLAKGLNKIRLPIPEKGIRGDRIRIDPGTMPGLYQISSISLMSLAQ
ncbi:alginate O-acetyltransferase AlgX-related protein [Desulfobacter sp.]|uniref:alginate O-acetyltransferase AlgX-related protein n=1 Tax=Desulfobacter sp. TaxID=2294 RepID=UPI003D0DA661